MRRVAVATWIFVTLATSLYAAPGEPESRARFVRAAGRQSDPSVATNGSDFLAVWTDNRGGRDEIYGTPVRADGTVVRPLGLDVSYPDKDCVAPRIVWTGQSYLVLWHSRSRLRAVQVAPDGHRLGEPRTLIDSEVYDVAVSSNGRVTMVAAYVRGSNASELHLLAFDRSGNLVASNRMTPAAYLSRLTVAAAGDGFAVVGISYFSHQLLVWRTDERGAVIAGTPVVLAENVLPYGFRAASSGGKALVVYSTWEPSATDLLSGFFITADEISPSFPIGLNEGYDIALTARDDGFALAFPRLTGYEIPPFLGDVGPFNRPSFDIDTMHIGLDGHIGSPTRLIRGAYSDQSPAIALSGNTLFITWIEYAIREDRRKIAAAVSALGLEDTRPIEIARSAPRQAFPAVASGGDDFLFVWQEEPSNDGTSTIMARTREGAAVSLPTTGLDHFYPSVAFDGTRYLVTWIERRPAQLRLVGRFVDRQGRPVGLPFDISDRYFDAHTRPATASNGDGFVVVYGGDFSIPPGGSRALRSARIDASGKVTRFELFVNTSTYLMGGALRLTAMHASYLVAWSDGRQVLVVQFMPGEPFGLVLDTLYPLVRPYDPPAIGCKASLCAIGGNESSGRLVTKLLPSNTEFAGLPYFHASEPQLLVANDLFVLLMKSPDSDTLDAWWTDTEDVAPVVKVRMIGTYAAASNSDGEIAIAYVAPATLAGGGERVHRSVVRR